MKIVSFVVGALLLFSSTVFASSNLINYQGKLIDSDGTVVDGELVMVFTIYDAPTDGVTLWSETKTVTLVGGIYETLLGDKTILDLPFDVPYYLGIKVGSDSEMSPRQPLTLRSKVFRTRQASTTIENAVNSSAIQDGSVELNRLAIICEDGEILVMTESGWDCGPFPE